jgi:hypothetical protein
VSHRSPSPNQHLRYYGRSLELRICLELLLVPSHGLNQARGFMPLEQVAPSSDELLQTFQGHERQEALVKEQELRMRVPI